VVSRSEEVGSEVKTLIESVRSNLGFVKNEMLVK
jgi:hypothetical protein